MGDACELETGYLGASLDALCPGPQFAPDPGGVVSGQRLLVRRQYTQESFHSCWAGHYLPGADLNVSRRQVPDLLRLDDLRRRRYFSCLRARSAPRERKDTLALPVLRD